MERCEFVTDSCFTRVCRNQYFKGLFWGWKFLGSQSIQTDLGNVPKVGDCGASGVRLTSPWEPSGLSWSRGVELEGDPASSTTLTPSQASWDPDPLPRHCGTEIPPGKQVIQRVWTHITLPFFLSSHSVRLSGVLMKHQWVCIWVFLILEGNYLC